MKLSALLYVALSVACAAPVLAQAPAVQGKDNFARSGTLSQSFQVGSGKASTRLPWEESDLSGQSAPISGSVSRAGNRDWIIRIFNSSDDSYSIDVSVDQYSADGKKLDTDFYSYTLKPKSNAERKFAAQLNTQDCALNLLRWRNLSDPKRN